MAEPPQPQQPHHRLTVDRTLGALHLRADLALAAPWTLIFGPSGSGKSSLLRAACGLLGQEGVRFSRQGLRQGSSQAPSQTPSQAPSQTPIRAPSQAPSQAPPGYDISLITRRHMAPPHRLGLGYAPQQGALFPHLSVEQNVQFALAARGQLAPRGPEADELLELFEIAPLRLRRPRMLSGGERQRVNLARAFAVPGARLLLLDEPFSGVGRALRDRLLERMQTWLREHNVPVLSVSHDVDEALLLGADVIVLEEGQVVRRGPASEALAAERERMLRALRA